MALLFALLVVAAEFGLDVVLGAFLAGVIQEVARVTSTRWNQARRGGYGFFIPVFFVASGMNLDLASIAEGAFDSLSSSDCSWPCGAARRCSSTAATSA